MGAPVSWWRHAFAVEDRRPLEPTPRQRQIADHLCREICRRRMQTPAHLFLESVRPMNYLGAQVLHFFEPFIALITDAEGYREFALFLEHRGAIDFLSRRLEEIEAAGDPACRDDRVVDDTHGGADGTSKHGS